MAYPHRPPRKRGDGCGQGATRQESSSAGLLVSVVRTLTTSASSDQRELEKRRLEHGYRETGKTIDALVSAHQEDLTQSLQSFRKVSSRITVARERIRNVRNSLSTCKSLLQCKRDELRKLWLENAEQKHISQLLRKVEEIKVIPHDADEAISRKRFLRASELLLEASVSLDGDLMSIEGLQNLKIDVRRKTQEVSKTILDEINRTIYLRPSEELMYELHKSAVSRAAASVSAAQESGPQLTEGSKSSAKEGACLLSTEDDFPIFKDNGCALEDDSVSRADASPVQYLAVLVEALGVLRKVPEAVEGLKAQITRGLMRMVQYTAQFYQDYQMKAQAPVMAPGNLGDSRHLAELMALIFRQFRVLTVLHHLLLAQFKRVIDTRHLGDVGLYGVEDVRQEIQIALKQLLADYLDIRGTSGAAAVSDESTAAALSTFFSKKRVVRPKKASLFRFESTAHAINVSAFAKEQKAIALPQKLTLLSSKESPDQIWVCPPNPSNITAVFRPIMKLASEMELKAGGKGPCQLRTFLEEYVRDTFLPRVKQELRDRADGALQTSDAWNTVVGLEEQRRLDALVPVLASSARTLALCTDVQNLMTTLPEFANQFAALWLLVLGEYQEKIKTEYEKATRSVRQMEGVDQPVEWRKISAAWAVDEDISRLLKSLPNWTSLVMDTGSVSDVFTPQTTTPHTPMTESTEEIRNRNQRESELLIGNLGTQKKIESWEIIQDIQHIRSLANIHESLEWFCGSVRGSLSQLPQNIQERMKSAEVQIEKAESPDQAPTVVFLSEGFERHLRALGEMASTCLLMLHLEVRVHCFYHLLPLARQASHVLGAAQSQEADASVLALNRDLVQLHELLATQLRNRKVRYLFEGLGHLVSAIFIHSSHYVSKINDNGKKRMCRNIFALQQCISGLTGSREPDLDTARKFFELLYLTPDEILNGILERGPEFGELEYRYILALCIRSHPIYSTEPGALDSRISRLREIMSERSK